MMVEFEQKYIVGLLCADVTKTLRVMKLLLHGTKMDEFSLQT
jgi:hypothetical protein